MYGPINSSGMALTINGMANARKGRIYHLLVIQSFAELRTAATLILQQLSMYQTGATILNALRL